jgi:predicted nucleic acid-binding protein
MLVVMVDTMVFDHLVADETAAEAVLAAIKDGRLQLRTTHVQEDQLAAIPDEAKRSAIAAIPREVVATSVSVYEISAYGKARYGSDDDDAAYEAIRHGPKHVQDAIIATTALSEAHVLVTDDKRLANRSRERLKVRVWSSGDLSAWARGRNLDAPDPTPLGAAGRLLEEAELLDLDQRVRAHGEALTLIVESLRELARERRAHERGHSPPGQVVRY